MGVFKETRNNDWTHRAKAIRNDEYYTLREDIEKELPYYSKYFRDKCVYLCCDSPRTSEFWHYFETRFEDLGLSKLIATHYFNGKDTSASILEKNNGKIVRRDIPLIDKGDFRSPECRAFMEQSDVVVTNPPFSLLTELTEMISQMGVDYLLVGPNHALTYKGIRRMISEGRCHAGVNSISKFEVRPGEYKSVQAQWFTSLDHKVIPHLPLVKGANESDYDHYLNIDAIEVGRVADIPDKYFGVMGVPISFFSKWDRSKFEILGVERHAIVPDEERGQRKVYARLLIKRRPEAA